MSLSIAIALHILSAVVWVGGMFFAYMALRPVAASQLEPPVRLSLWAGVFGKFFPWVWLSILVLIGSGYMMIFKLYQTMNASPLYILIMMILGFIMMLIFLHVFFGPYRRLKQAVAAEDWPMGGSKLAQIRMLTGINTLIGLAVVAIAAGGRYLV
ncbi:MAG: hypothetical protein GXP13_08800 [Gammaproteobacteria bacterium]|nr:hypothetical protein [Gammaproteobacteria bacterium]